MSDAAVLSASASHSTSAHADRTATALLSLEDLSIEFRSMAGTTKAVAGLSMAIAPGRTVALVGESGSGKSVTSQAILGILPKNGVITSGRILFRDADLGTVDLAAIPRASPKFRSIRGRSIAMVFQEPMTAFSPLHTLGDQIGEMAAIHRRASKAEIAELTIETLRLVRFPEPERAVRMYPFELSGGLRQRAMIAMALMCRPPLLIADEPTTALDVTLQAQILKLLKDLQAELDMAVLLITHDLGVVANLAEEVVVMHHGRVVESGPARTIFTAPSHPYLVSLMKAVPDFSDAERRRLTPIREIKIDADALVKPKASGPKGEPLVEARGLEKGFALRGDRRLVGRAPARVIRALADVSLTVRRGECLGLVGESGSGKTTLARALMRAVPVDAGSIVLHGADGQGGGTVDLVGADRETMFKVRKRMQYIFQDPFSSLDPRMTVGAILSEPLEIHDLCKPAERRERVARLLSAVGLDPSFAGRYPHSFSGGQRQRIGIARALALEPEILICDEPVAALDVSVQAQILNLLKDLQRLSGLTYVFITHNLAVVNHIADRIVVMCDGAIVELAPRAELFRRPLHPYTKLLIEAVPHADLARPLDFSNLPEAGLIGRREWPGPFTVAAGEPLPPLLEASPGHFVRAADLGFLDTRTDRAHVAAAVASAVEALETPA